MTKEEDMEKMARRKGTPERTVERYLAARVAGAGGLCLKYSNPGMTGYPDRICLLPGGRTAWVELKGSGGRVSRMQALRMAALREVGQEVHVLRSREDVDEFMERHGEGGGHEV